MSLNESGKEEIEIVEVSEEEEWVRPYKLIKSGIIIDDSQVRNVMFMTQAPMFSSLSGIGRL